MLYSISLIKVVSIACLLILTSCASTFYHVSDQDGQKVELHVSPDRIVLECELASDKKEVPYGFMMHVLDEQNTVLSAIHGTTLDENTCLFRIKKISRILKTGKKMYIAGIGGHNNPRKSEAQTYDFPGLGVFHGNGRVLQLFSIANENGACFSTYHRDNEPCPHPDDGFPIKDHRATK